MAVSWIAPAALFGLVLVVLPIAVHLLVRQHTRVLAYPSLRFLRETQLASLRRRTIQDALLLLCRVAIIAAAVLALAGPVLRTPGRTAGYSSRTSRAIVAIGPVDANALRSSVAGAFASATFTRPTVADALADAVRWLDQQPPSAREIVVIGELRRGVIDDSDLAAVPSAIGVRFVPIEGSSPVDQTFSVLTRRGGSLVRIDRRVRLDADTTAVTDGVSTPVPSDLVRIVAGPRDAALAEAALRAALDAGVPWSDFDRPVVVSWEDRMAMPSPAAAADAVRELLQGLSRPDLKDPVAINAEQLATWSRPPGPPSPSAPLSDEGDRRWLWGGALLLLAIEWWMRRSAPTAKNKTDAAAEARVA